MNRINQTINNTSTNTTVIQPRARWTRARTWRYRKGRAAAICRRRVRTRLPALASSPEVAVEAAAVAVKVTSKSPTTSAAITKASSDRVLPRPKLVPAAAAAAVAVLPRWSPSQRKTSPCIWDPNNPLTHPSPTFKLVFHPSNQCNSHY